MIDNEEHHNADETHRITDCPGPDECACARGLLRLLDELRSGRMHLRRVK